MKLNKSAVKLLIVIIILLTGVYLVKARGILNNLPWLNLFNQKKTELDGSIKGVTKDLEMQTEELSKRSNEVGKHVGNILNTYVQSNQTTNNTASNQSPDSANTQTTNQSNQSSSPVNNAPVYQRTFEYGRYVYCQQVVKDYDDRYTNR